MTAQGANYNAKLIEDQKKRDKEAAFTQARKIADIKTLLKLPAFRRHCWDVWETTGIFRDPFAQNAMLMARECGVGSVGRTLLADVNDADVSAFAQIQAEAISDRKAREAEEKTKEEENAKPH